MNKEDLANMMKNGFEGMAGDAIAGFTDMAKQGGMSEKDLAEL